MPARSGCGSRAIRLSRNWRRLPARYAAHFGPTTLVFTAWRMSNVARWFGAFPCTPCAHARWPAVGVATDCGPRPRPALLLAVVIYPPATALHRYSYQKRCGIATSARIILPQLAGAVGAGDSGGRGGAAPRRRLSRPLQRLKRALGPRVVIALISTRVPAFSWARTPKPAVIRDFTTWSKPCAGHSRAPRQPTPYSSPPAA